MVFWEKEWGTINAQSYIQYIVPLITEYIHHHPHLQVVQDGAPGHGAQFTIRELERNGVYMIRWPPFSPDLNLIEMVWN
jgi:transposase